MINYPSISSHENKKALSPFYREKKFMIQWTPGFLCSSENIWKNFKSDLVKT